MKAILIDSANQKLVPIELDKSKELLNQYYELIGNNCQCIDAPYEFSGSDVLIVDDEGLFNNAQFGFKFPDFNYPIVGNAIIIGVDEETGDSVSVNSPIEAFKNIIWCDKFEIKAYISKMLGDFTNEADLQALKKMANYELIQISKDLKNSKLPKDSLAAITISKYFGVEVGDLDDSHYLAFQYILSNELALRLEYCMSSF
jgi:hypothetical protein